MSEWIMWAAALLPAAILWLYIWKKDSQPEPTSWLIKAVLLGVGICIPVVIVEIGIEILLFSADIAPTDLVGTTYAVCIGLGFAAIENVFYILGEEEWMSVAVSRALLAVPAHYAFAILMGYYYSVYHFVDHSIKNAICILLVPVMAHGIYDAIVFAADMIPTLSIVITIVLIVFCSKMWKYAKARMEELMLRN